MPTGESVDFIKKSIHQHKWDYPIIDLGTGDYLSYYQPIFPTVKITTLDFAQNGAKDIDIIADLLKLPPELYNKYGLALCSDTLEHVRDPFIAVKEIYKILKPGGLFLLSTVACWGVHGHPNDYYRFLPEGLKYICENAGFKTLLKYMIPDSATVPSHSCIVALKE